MKIMKIKKPLESLILTVRGHKVLMDSDLAEIYGVPTKVFNQAVKRNAERFPEDFCFRLTLDEAEAVLRSRSQFVTLKRGQNLKYLPHAFTEHGAIMAATVLNSKRAIEMSIFVVRAFVGMRQALAVNQHVVSKLSELEARLDSHDADIQDLVEAIRELMAPLPANSRRIGFEAPLAVSRARR